MPFLIVAALDQLCADFKFLEFYFILLLLTGPDFAIFFCLLIFRDLFDQFLVVDLTFSVQFDLIFIQICEYSGSLWAHEFLIWNSWDYKYRLVSLRETLIASFSFPLETEKTSFGRRLVTWIDQNRWPNFEKLKDFFCRLFTHTLHTTDASYNNCSLPSTHSRIYRLSSIGRRFYTYLQN